MSKSDIIAKLRQDMLVLEGFKPPAVGVVAALGLGPLEAAFPHGVFPRGVLHEFVGDQLEHIAASSGFITGLLQGLMNQGRFCIWITTSKLVFPPALKLFGVAPDRIIFIQLSQEKDVLWAMEEALKCEGLAAVIAEVGQLNFSQSRRLQLATEKSRVTGLVIRTDSSKISTTVCVARWRITPLRSGVEEGMPGLGYPRWQVELLKVKNGNPGTWRMEWAGQFVPLSEQPNSLETVSRKVG